MPELPEVETIARSLRQPGPRGPGIVGLRIVRAELFWQRTLHSPSVEEFLRRIAGQQVLEVGRRGKFLQIKLEHDYLFIHLRMSGDIRVEPLVDECGQLLPIRKHDRAAFYFGEPYRLIFEDARKFGRIWLAENPADVVGGLGPEPLDLNLTPELFHERLLRVKRQLKPLLLDQTFLAGLGNIYTDEALHRAHLHPLTPSDRLSFADSTRLLAAIRFILQKGIETNGASIDWVYRGGGFQNTFQVYGRAGQVCYTCGSTIQKITVGQRGTHFCPVCQPDQKGIENSC